MESNRSEKGNPQRRQALLQAAIDIIAERGYLAVTHRTVTERAGTTISAVGYYFASIQELADEAFASFTQGHIDQHRALALALHDSSASANQMIDAFSKSAVADDKYTLAAIEAYLRAARDDGFRDLVREALAATRSVGEAVADLAGAPDGKALAPSLYALLMGAALQRLAVPDAVDEHLLPDAFRTMLIGALYQAGHEEQARHMRDLSHSRA